MNGLSGGGAKRESWETISCTVVEQIRHGEMVRE